MGQRTKVKLGDEWVDGEELEFEPLRESWNEYRCSDGALVRVKLVVAKITKLDRRTATGEPVYLVNSSNVVGVTAPASEVGG